MKEVDFQSLIIKDVRAAGGYAIKLSNRFLVGVPDLLVKMPEGPVTIMEVKVGKVARGFIHAAPSPRQEVEMRKMKAAGITVNLAIVYEYKREKYLRLTSDLNPFRQDLDVFKFQAGTRHPRWDFE